MRLTDEQIERARTVNLPHFLMANGFDLKKAGREFVWKDHDSLHIRDNAPGECGQWYRFSENKGGDNIGFLREYMGMSFVEAVEALNGEHYERTYASPRTYEPKPEKKKDGVFKIEEADNTRRVFAYLCKTRGLDCDLISSLVKSGVIAQEQKTGNVLFKYYDTKGKVIGAEKVGTSTERKFKGIAAGSAGGHGFEVCKGNGENLLFFESAIDMLSYLQMHDKKLDNCRLVSMMGVKPNIVLDTMARHNISPENVYLCSDNDIAGSEFADRLREQYPKMKRIVTSDTYKDWNDMLRGILKQTEQEKDKKEADRKNMQYYGNEMWNKATDNRDKSLVTMRLSDFQRVQETLEKSGINYYAYEMNGTVRMAVNDKDIDWLRNIFGNVNITKSNKSYSPPEKNIFGTAEYRYIPQKEYLTADRDLVLKMADIMAKRGIQFSGRVYPSGKGTLTVSHADLYAVRSIRDEVTNMRKQFANPEKGEPVGNRDYRANCDTHYYMSKLTPEQFKEVKPFLETSVSYHAVSRDGKVAFAVDKENAPAFHRALENAVREVGMLRNISDLGLPMEHMNALSPVIHRLAVEDMKLNIADFFDKRYDEAQFGEMLSLINAYLLQAPAERYGENSKLNDMLEAKSSFDRSIELSDFFSQHDFSDEQKAAITSMFVGDVTRGQINSIDETFTAEDIQAYDEILHNALQESDVVDFLTAHKQAVIDRENAEKVPTEEEVLFSQADLARFLAERTLSSDEWEDMAYPLFEKGYIDRVKSHDNFSFGGGLSEHDFYDMARRYHNGDDIRRELALGLLEGGKSSDMEFVFVDGKMSDEMFFYSKDLHHKLHAEKTENGYKCSFSGMERFVSFEEIGQAFIDRTHEEFDDLIYWRVLDYIKDDIPDIADETVQQLITAFDGAALPDWEKGDNVPKLNRIKKALFDILGDEVQTEKAFACIAKHKYNVTFEAEKPESSIHFGLLGNGITAYDVSRTDKETNDYPTVAHISPEGVVKIYDDSLSVDDMERINEQAQSAREKFMTDWNMLSPEQQFQKLIDRADISTTVNINRDKLSMEQKVEKYMPFVFFGEGERPEPQMEEQVKGTYMIYQLPDGEKYHGIRFEGMKQLEKEGVQLNHEDYNLVYEGKIDDFKGNADLEALYAQFNTNHPADFKGHSLSVSDVIVISVDGNDTAYYCDSIGFVEMPEFFKEKELLQDKSANPQEYSLEVSMTSDAFDEPYCIAKIDADGEFIDYYEDMDGYIPTFSTIAEVLDFAEKNNLAVTNDLEEITENLLDKAKALINDFCEEEYRDGADFSDLHNVSLAYTTLTDDELPIQVAADLLDHKITYKFDGEVFNTEQYDSIEDMIEKGLTGLDFNDLVSVPDGIIEKHTGRDEQTVDLMAAADETADIDKPLFTDDSVIEEIQRNENASDNRPFWEIPDIKGEQLSIFGDSEPLVSRKAAKQKHKSEFAAEPVIDGVQMYEALAAEIDRGTGFVGGKLRVQDFYEQQHPTLQQLADFLKKEYGTGGHSGEGKISFVDYNSKGMTFSFENDEKFRHSWYNVAVMTESRLKDNTYLSAEQKAERAALKEKLTNEHTAPDTVEVDDRFRHKITGEVSEVVSLTGALPFYTDDCTVSRESGSFAITENISYDRLLNSDLYEYIGRNTVEKSAPDKPEVVPEAEKTDISTVKSLAQLKRSIKPGMMFEISDHLRPECIGERRVVTSVNSVEFTSQKLDENGEPTGKDLHMEFDKAANWTFNGSELTSRIDENQVLMSFHFIDGSERSRQSERNAEKQNDTSAVKPDKDENFTITDEALGEGSAKTKFKNNIAAIETLKTIEKENRSATNEEKETLSKYVGWGGIPQAFDKNNEKWSAEYQELAEMLTPEEYRQANASVLDAFYTSPTVIDSIYEAFKNFGFEGGNVLEPAMGIGNFFGRMPKEMQDNSHLYGVEIDSISGRIAQKLYPDADIAIQGFEKNRFQNGCFDIAVGNVPFGELGFKDNKHNTTKLHDYFFAESLEKVKNGGIMHL